MARHNEIDCPKNCGHPQGEHYTSGEINSSRERYDCKFCSCRLKPRDLAGASGFKYVEGVGWDYA
jgi:hypothetical protein